MTLISTQLENCADWNMRESEIAAHKATTATTDVDRGYFQRRSARLDMQAFRLFRAAHEARV